jgi:uncharacterized protein YjbI with pentapeptide repeats
MAEVRDEDWDGRDLSGLEHVDSAFVDVDMTQARSANSTFEGCTFLRVRFNASQHAGDAFVNCTFRQCSFFDAMFDGCKVIGSTFDRCTFTSMKVLGGDWSFTGFGMPICAESSTAFGCGRPT